MPRDHPQPPGAIGVAEAELPDLRLWHLLVLVLVLSVVCRIFSLPDAFVSGAIGVATIQVLAVLIAVIVYAHGSARAFCIGALIPTCFVAFVVAMMFNTVTWGLQRDGFQNPLYPLEEMANGLRFVVVTWFLMGLVAGVLSVLVRWLIVRGQSGD
jgi:high-affinity Fe2+/Pb2+ permease